MIDAQKIVDAHKQVELEKEQLAQEQAKLNTPAVQFPLSGVKQQYPLKR